MMTHQYRPGRLATLWAVVIVVTLLVIAAVAALGVRQVWLWLPGLIFP